MKFIIIAFSLKGQEFAEIKESLQWISHHHRPEPVVLIHGFMPRKEVEAKGFSTNLVDTLQELFPIQLNLYQNVPLRIDMAIVGKKLDAHVYVIGEEIDGVADEVANYKRMGLEITYFSL